MELGTKPYEMMYRLPSPDYPITFFLIFSKSPAELSNTQKSKCIKTLQYCLSAFQLHLTVGGCILALLNNLTEFGRVYIEFRTPKLQVCFTIFLNCFLLYPL